MHLVTVNEDKLGRKVRTGGANLEVTTVMWYTNVPLLQKKNNQCAVLLLYIA